jgi:predicted dehydrogenase
VATLDYGHFEGVIRASKSAELNAGSGIETDRGILIHRDFKSPGVEFIPHSGGSHGFVAADPATLVHGRPDMYRLQIEDFVQSCHSGQAPTVGLDEGIAVTRMLEALYSCRRPIHDDWYSDAPPEEACRA